MAALVNFFLGIKPSNVEPEHTSIYDIPVKTIRGVDTTLEQYKGKVMLIVNIAGKCGFTPQLSGLEKLYKDNAEKGLVVLGFPANDFLHQEPGSNEQIESACSLNYGVTFPLFEKIVVHGPGQHQLYAFLTSPNTDPEFHGEITWNFNKFLISSSGKIINRFGSKTTPEDSSLVKAVQDALNEKPTD